MNSPQRTRLAVGLVLILLCYLVFFYRLGHYALWDPDEGRSGLIAKEMVASGNWLTLTQSGVPYYDKPAPYFWLLALGIKFLGLDEFAVRLPSALAASLTIGVVSLWGYLSGGWKRGLWAGIVLATSMEFIVLGRAGKMDMVFTFFFTAALFSFLRWEEQGEGKRWIWFFYLLLALALLTKGPAGVLLPSLIVGIYLALAKRWEVLWEMRLPQGLTVILLVSGPWYLLAGLRDPEYIKTFFWDHNVMRYFTTERGINHPEPIYYFLPILIGGFLPWSLMLPPMVHDFWRCGKKDGREDTLFLLVWVITVLIFFSLARNKLSSYILPVFPPLALLTADFLRRSAEESEVNSWLRMWIFSASLVWLLFDFALYPLSEMILKNRHPEYLPLNPPLLPASLFILAAALARFLHREGWIPWVVSGSSLWFILWFYGVKAHEISEVRSARSLAQIVNRNAPKEYRAVALRAESFSFYLPHHVQVVRDPLLIEDMLNESVPTIALLKERHVKELQRIPPSRLFVWKVISSTNALVANFPPPPAQDLGRVPKG